MKKEEVRTKNHSAPDDEAGTPEQKSPPRPEPGADSQLHNYNVMLSRLGDLFGDDEELVPPQKPLRNEK